MEPFHAFTNQPKRSGLVLATVTPVIVVGFLALVAGTSGAFRDPLLISLIGGFAVVALVLVVPVCMHVISVEEVLIDHQALLIRRTFRGRTRERSVRLAPGARAHTGLDQRWHIGTSNYQAINIELLDGKTFYFGEGLGRSEQIQLADQINAYLSTS